ncbi:hypothetical protein [Paenibacillus sp. HJGM_3]|uniref:hypothetical protein n=1 Tax=Paenibacillus sp. HJGM_3 TaxID=3379816 RepID=UPI00385BBDD6
MGRIEQIKEKIEFVDKYRDRIEPYEYVEDMTELLSLLQIVEESLYKYSDMIVLDSEERPHDVGMVARAALEQIRQ